MWHLMLKSMCDVDRLTSSTIDLARLATNRACLKEHVAETNYQSRICKMAHIAIYVIPKPWEGHGWKEDMENQSKTN